MIPINRMDTSNDIVYNERQYQIDIIEKGLENLTLLSDFKFKNLNTQLKEKKNSFREKEFQK